MPLLPFESIYVHIHELETDTVPPFLEGVGRWSTRSWELRMRMRMRIEKEHFDPS